MSAQRSQERALTVGMTSYCQHFDKRLFLSCLEFCGEKQDFFIRHEIRCYMRALCCVCVWGVYIYIYIYWSACVCVCVCVSMRVWWFGI